MLSQLRCDEKREKVGYNLQMKDLDFHSLVRTWETFPEALVAKNWERCWEEKDLTKRKMFTTLSSYTLSWYTQTWLSTILLAIRRPHYCVVSFLFQRSNPETLYLLDNTYIYLLLLIHLLDVMESVLDKVSNDRLICIVLQQVKITIQCSSFSLLFESRWVESLQIIETFFWGWNQNWDSIMLHRNSNNFPQKLQQTVVEMPKQPDIE